MYIPKLGLLVSTAPGHRLGEAGGTVPTCCCGVLAIHSWLLCWFSFYMGGEEGELGTPLAFSLCL